MELVRKVQKIIRFRISENIIKIVKKFYLLHRVKTLRIFIQTSLDQKGRAIGIYVDNH